MELNSRIRKVWAWKGSKPVCSVSGAKEKVHIFGVLDERRTFTHMFAERENSHYFVQFLETLLVTYDKMLLVLDNAPWHRSHAIQDFVKKYADRLQLICLSAYSPELNPTEKC